MTRQTSRDAYYRIRDGGLLGKRQFEVYHILSCHDPLTGGEVCDIIRQNGRVENRNATASRLGELRDRGVIEELDVTRICKVTGNKVTVWAVTANLPTKPKPKPKKISKVDEAIKEERRACAEIAMRMGHRKVSDEILSRNNLTLF